MADVKPHNYRPDIDGMRAIAVMAVILFHLKLSGMEGGFVGVDIFFVISGFLITRILLRDVTAGTFSFSNFYLRRIRRLFPALLVTVFFTYLAALFIFPPDLFRQVSGATIHSIASLANIYYWGQAGYFDTGAYLKPLLHTWSLSVEEQFYFFWPALMLVLFRKGVTKFAVWALVAVCGLSFLANFTTHDGFIQNITPGFLQFTANDAFFMFPFRIFEFGLGALVIPLLKYKPLKGLVAELVLGLGIILMITSIMFLDESKVFPSYNALWPCLGAALAIWAGQAKGLGILLRNKGSVWIGKLSYSLYLVHWPITIFYFYKFGTKLSWLEVGLLLVAMFISSFLIYTFVESRFRRPKQKRMDSEGKPIKDYGFGLASALIAFCLVLPASHSWANQGWTWRLANPTAAKNVDFSGSFATRHYGGKDCDPPRCELRKSRRNKIYVLGDSHARHFFEGFKTSFRRHNVITYTRSACSFFSLEYVKPKKVKNGNCTGARKEAFKVIQEQKGGIVILGLNWEGGNFSDGVVSLKSGEKIKFKNSKDYAKFVASEIKTLKSKTRNTQFFVIGNVPTFQVSGSPTDCAFPPFREPKGCKTTSISDIPRLKRRAKMNDHFGRALKGIAEFVDPYEYLCSDGNCVNVVDGYPIYSDTTHLSDKGAEYLLDRAEEDIISKFK